MRQLATIAKNKNWGEPPELSDLAGRRPFSFELATSMEKVRRVLAASLKPNRKVLSAIRFSDGRMEEVRDTAAEPDAALEERIAAAKAAVAGATVATPTLGCPAPDFVQAELKARTVLEAFLDERQRDDFRRFNAFATEGASGTRYMVTSRHARGPLTRFERSLYDLDRGHPICTHDWTVPAAEEMLALHLHVSLPGAEEYVRGLV